MRDYLPKDKRRKPTLADYVKAFDEERTKYYYKDIRDHYESVREQISIESANRIVNMCGVVRFDSLPKKHYNIFMRLCRMELKKHKKKLIKKI